MKTEHIVLRVGPVSREDDIVIPISIEESHSLKEALETINKYKKRADSILKTRFADFTEYEYRVCNDKVIVNVRQGACG